ncbi:hypothetical protein D9M72_614760 [compost metagenome]
MGATQCRCLRPDHLAVAREGHVPGGAFADQPVRIHEQRIVETSLQRLAAVLEQREGANVFQVRQLALVMHAADASR